MAASSKRTLSDPPGPIRAVIFDMDGVLVDSERQWRLAEVAVFERLGLDPRTLDTERFVGLGADEIYDLIVEDHGRIASRKRFAKLSQGVAREVYRHRVTLQANTSKLIAQLKSHGLAVGLASSSPRSWIKMVFDRFRLYKLFDTVISINDAKGIGKPEPDIYLLAAKRLRTLPRECVAIEDSYYGVKSAKRAGMRCIGLRNGSNSGQDLSEADAEIHGFKNLNYRTITNCRI